MTVDQNLETEGTERSTEGGYKGGKEGRRDHEVRATLCAGLFQIHPPALHTASNPL